MKQVETTTMVTRKMERVSDSGTPIWTGGCQARCAIYGSGGVQQCREQPYFWWCREEAAKEEAWYQKWYVVLCITVVM